METISSIIPNASRSVSIIRARFVIGPSAITEQPLPSAAQVRTFSHKKSTAVWLCSYPSTSGRKLSPRPSSPCVSNAFTYSRLSGTASPRNTGISSRSICFNTFFALPAPISTGELPQTMVIPSTCNVSIDNASMIARLSSIPGSQSMITRLFSFSIFCPLSLQRQGLFHIFSANCQSRFL